MLARRLETQFLWLIMPSIVLASAGVMTLQKADSLHTVSGSFLVMKAMEYSVRGVTSEMVSAEHFAYSIMPTAPSVSYKLLLDQGLCFLGL